jgi:hypothetical protein
MEKDLQYLRERVDGIADVLSKNTAVLEQNTESLKEHMRRTEILEGQMDTALWPIRIAKVLMWAGGVIMFVSTVYYYYNQVIRP